jgi:hypothetical protein
MDGLCSFIDDSVSSKSSVELIALGVRDRIQLSDTSGSGNASAMSGILHEILRKILDRSLSVGFRSRGFGSCYGALSNPGGLEAVERMEGSLDVH